MQQRPGDYQLPPGVALTMDLGEIRLPGGDGDVDARDYGFFVGNDDNMWTWRVPVGGTIYSPPHRVWDNEGRPGGAQIRKAMGTLIVDGIRPYVFVAASDGCLWTRYWDWSEAHWENLGRPGAAEVAGPMGTWLADGNRPLIFMKASDGNLWLCQSAYNSWTWDNLGMPAGNVSPDFTVGITMDGDLLYLFFRGSDGDIWCRWWSGGAWEWAHHGRPEPDQYITGGGGARFQRGGGTEWLDVGVYTTNGFWKLRWRGDWKRWFWERAG